MSENKYISATERLQYGDGYIGQVVRILDKYSIIVSTNRVVKVDDTVQVFDVGEDLTDLDGTSLGNYIYVKDTLSVVQVEPNYCICKAVVKEKVRPLLSTPFTDMTRTVKLQHPLSVQDNDINEIPNIDMSVKIGDKVRLQ